MILETVRLMSIKGAHFLSVPKLPRHFDGALSRKAGTLGCIKLLLASCFPTSQLLTIDIVLEGMK